MSRPLQSSSTLPHMSPSASFLAPYAIGTSDEVSNVFPWEARSGSDGIDPSLSLMDLAHVAQSATIPVNAPHHHGIVGQVLQSADKQPADIITESARQSILDLFSDGSLDLNVPCFCVDALKVYLELYFLHMEHIHPMIHRPTMARRANAPHPLLLLSLVGHRTRLLYSARRCSSSDLHRYCFC